MGFPTFHLEGRKLARVIFSVRQPSSSDARPLFPLTKALYERGIWCFDLPSMRHVESFRQLKVLVEDEGLIGVSHIEAEEGVSFLGAPLRRVESKITSTLKKNLFPSHLIQTLKQKGVWNSRYFFAASSSSEVLTQKEIDRIAFDPVRFDRALARHPLEESPFLMIGGKYGDWLLALGRFDLLKEMVAKIREKGLIPIFSNHWTTFALPKAKPLDVAAYSVPINSKWGFFDFDLACKILKKFDRPLIGLDPLAMGTLVQQADDALSFLFEELNLTSVIVEVESETDADHILRVLGKFPSLTPRRKT